MDLLLKENEKVKNDIHKEKNIMDVLLKDEKHQVMLHNNQFEKLVSEQKELYKIKKREQIETQIKELRNIKKPLSEVKVGIRDSLGANLFFLILLMLVVFDINNYWMYVLGPLSGYLFGYYFLPQKIKIIDYDQISKMEESIDLKAEEGFENIVADRNILSAFKKEFGSDALENVFLNSAKEQKSLLLEKNQSENVVYNITIGELLRQAKEEDVIKSEKLNIREVVGII